MDEAEERRAERAAQAEYHTQAQRQRSEQESEKAQTLIDRFVAEATAAGLPTEELRVRPWSGRGRYRTGVTGWYLRRNQSIGVGVDGSYYVLSVPKVPFGRLRTVRVDPSPPPLEVGRGGRDGESITLETLLNKRLEWSSTEG